MARVKTSPQVSASAPDELIDYEAAAAILGIKRKAVSQLVSRGHLHKVPNAVDRRYGRLSRREVEARARFAAEHPTGNHRPQHVEPPPALPPLPSLANLLDVPPERVIVGEAGGMVLLALALLATGDTASPVLRGLMLGGIAALGVAIIAELYAQGRISDAERRRLELLARAAEADPEPLLAELGPRLRILPSSGPAA